MRLFEKKIKKQQLMRNTVITLKFLLIVILLVVLVFDVFFFIFIFTEGHRSELFFFAISLKIFLVLILLYLVLQVKRSLLNKFEAAKSIDEFNEDKNDTFQNAIELLSEKADEIILERIFKKADKKAEKQVIKADFSGIRQFLIPFILILLSTLIIFGTNIRKFRETYNFFSMLKLPEVQHKEFIEITPGDLSIIRNSKVTIEVINPEPEVEHRFFYKIHENWREELLPNHRKVFNNLDFSFSYFVQTPFAVSDTFKIEVFELPIIKNITLRYDFPKYTKLKPETEIESSGNIKAVKGTVVSLNIEANNPIEEAYILFSDGNLKEMERIGRNSFRTYFKLDKSGSYHFGLLDFLGNKSQKISKSITVIPDRKPEIKIISPGKDTLITQNMLLPLKIFASDDFGISDLKLFYSINLEEETLIEIQKSFRGNTVTFDYVFDLTEMFLIPGDKITYWVEISDNSPQKQKARSRKYIARFPSIEEIYQEIEREEKAKSDILTKALERSFELQKEFEKKRRELMKKEELDWEDRKELEKFLQKQENLNEDIDKVAEDFQSLIEKFEDNRALSKETLEKMQRIQELMEEISNEQLQEALEKLRENLENLDPDVLRKAMENFKFSMEDFAEKLEQTIKLLEDIKKEQSIQKALEIAEEMEEMQSKLNEKTEERSKEKGEQDASDLAQEQQNISDKLETLEDQLEKAQELMDQDKDKEILDKMNQLGEQMEQDSLASDLQESAENLQNNQMEQAQQCQQQALSKMKKMTQKLQNMQQMMSSCSMMEIGDIIEKTIRRLLIFSQMHEESSYKYDKDPFLILPDQIAIFEGINLTLKELYNTPMIILVIGPKFLYDANFTSSNYRELFQHINEAKTTKVNTYLKDIQKGINIMIFDLMQAASNMQQGGGCAGMQSLMQALQQMSQQQLALNMMTQQLMLQLSEDGQMSQQMRSQAQRLASDEQRLAENLKRVLQTNRDAQNQTSAINQIIEDLEAISHDLKRGRLDNALIEKQERILSRLLDAQKSIHKREFSKKRKSEISEIEDWDLPEEIKLKFDKMRRKALLNDDYKDYPKEYQELIREYLRLLNEKANSP